MALGSRPTSCLISRPSTAWRGVKPWEPDAAGTATMVNAKSGIPRISTLSEVGKLLKAVIKRREETEKQNRTQLIGAKKRKGNRKGDAICPWADSARLTR